jgi:hypothetical protein
MITPDVVRTIIMMLHIHQKLLIISGSVVFGEGHERITERGGEGPPGILKVGN